MELKAHFVALFPEETEFDHDMDSGILQVAIDVAKKHNNYEEVAEMFMALLDLRCGPDVFPCSLDQALRELADHLIGIAIPLHAAIVRSVIIERPDLYAKILP